jgi:hypothetical protein
MEQDKIRERVLALESIIIPRLNKETRDLIQDVIFEGSYQSVEYYNEFMKLVDMHKSKRLKDDRFYKLLEKLVDEIKVYLKKDNQK